MYILNFSCLNFPIPKNIKRPYDGINILSLIGEGNCRVIWFDWRNEYREKFIKLSLPSSYALKFNIIEPDIFI